MYDPSSQIKNISITTDTAHTNNIREFEYSVFSSNKLVYVVPLENEAEINFYSV